MNLIDLKRFYIKVLPIAFLMILTSSVKAVGLGDTRIYEFEQSDEELNKIYKILFNKLKLPDQKKLRISQRAWIKFRDLDCGWAFRAESLGCMIHRTDNRIKELKESLFNDIHGNYSSIELGREYNAHF